MNNIMRTHFINPQNIGKIKKPTHTAKCKSGFCGDMVEVYAIVEDDIVKELKYNVFGCHAVIATASILSEWAKDKSLTEIKNLTYESVVEMLGDVESEKENCVKTAMQAFIQL